MSTDPENSIIDAAGRAQVDCESTFTHVNESFGDKLAEAYIACVELGAARELNDTIRAIFAMLKDLEGRPRTSTGALLTLAQLLHDGRHRCP
jgi:hypothetical protein